MFTLKELSSQFKRNKTFEPPLKEHLLFILQIADKKRQEWNARHLELASRQAKSRADHFGKFALSLPLPPERGEISLRSWLYSQYGVFILEEDGKVYLDSDGADAIRWLLRGQSWEQINGRSDKTASLSDPCPLQDSRSTKELTAQVRGLL